MKLEFLTTTKTTKLRDSVRYFCLCIVYCVIGYICTFYCIHSIFMKGKKMKIQKEMQTTGTVAQREEKCFNQKPKAKLYFAIKSSYILRICVRIFIFLFTLHVRMKFNSLQLTRNGLVIKHAHKVAKTGWKIMEKIGAQIWMKKNLFPFVSSKQKIAD